jgi:hypothetical protein
MKASISTHATANEMTITIHHLNWADIQQAAFSEGELQVRDLLQLIGQELTRDLLRSKDLDVPSLELNRNKQHWYTHAAAFRVASR